jgi:hypothetical protein
MAKVKQSAFDRLRMGARLNRKERRVVEQRLSAADPALEIVNRDAAGIDVGNESHYVAVPRGRDAQPVREFGSWTAALVEMAQWLVRCGIRTVVMQSTGVYWIAVHDVLQKHGLEVYLVDARGTKNVPGRKSDVQECQWLMRLHTYGLCLWHKENGTGFPLNSGSTCGAVGRLASRCMTLGGPSVRGMVPFGSC